MNSEFASLTAALILAAAYLFGGWFSGQEASKEFWERRRWISAAAGISVAYVFVDVLPELGAQQRVFAEATGNAPLLFVEERMYGLALLSFVVFYGLDYMVLSKHGQRRDAAASGERDAVYWLHLLGFAAYSGLIGYLLVERAGRGSLALGRVHLRDGRSLSHYRAFPDRGARAAAAMVEQMPAGRECPRRVAAWCNHSTLRDDIRAFVCRAGRRSGDHQSQPRTARRPERALLAILPGRSSICTRPFCLGSGGSIGARPKGYGV